MSSTTRHLRARVASLTRSRPLEDPELQSARTELRTARLEDRIRAEVAEWPPLTDEQRGRLAALLRPTTVGDRGA